MIKKKSLLNYCGLLGVAAKQSVQCMYSGVCNDGMRRHSG